MFGSLNFSPVNTSTIGTEGDTGAGKPWERDWGETCSGVWTGLEL